MSNCQEVIAVVTFVSVIFLLITEWLHFMIVAFLGALVLIISKVMTMPEAISYIGKSYGTLGLFFGVMVMVRAFQPTRVFEYLATKMVIWANGRGDRLLLSLMGLVTIMSAVLPNATTVMLLAPLIPPIAQEIGVDFIPLLILITFVANSGGLLTLVGDPVTYIVGDALNISFVDYLTQISWGGVAAVGTIGFCLPVLFRRIWRKKLTNLDRLAQPEINHPRALVFGTVITVFVLVFFVIGDSLPIPISPVTVALLGAALALLLSHHSRIDSVQYILRDVDWSTLIFFMGFFVLIGGLEKTGVILKLSEVLAIALGQDIGLTSLILLFAIGLLSSVVPNIPLVVAMVPLLKQLAVNAGWSGIEILAPGFQGQLPAAVLPMFYAMILGATLGGNGTLVGASANLVAAGVAEQYGKRISFKTFLRYGIPMMAIQLGVAALYLSFRFLIWV